jgi:UDP-N-acetylglucosamine--N-acetylmuramyl-(pentapeptide) pyrophosphoryl-undecaprenol N-acetylglucosamine transferase
LADLVESMSGIDLMDVIRVGEPAAAATLLRARASTAAAGGEKTGERSAA